MLTERFSKFFTADADKQKDDEQQEAAVLERRRMAAAQLEAATLSKAEKLPPYQQAERDAQARIDRAEAEIRAAKAALVNAQCDRFAIVAEFDGQIAQARTILLATIPEELLDFERWLLAEYEATRHKIETARGISPDHMIPKIVVKSNAKHIKARLEAIKNTRERVEQMKFEHCDDIAAEIAGLKAALPPDDYPVETVEGDIPQLPRDSYQRYGGSEEQKRAEHRILWQ